MRSLLLLLLILNISCSTSDDSSVIVKGNLVTTQVPTDYDNHLQIDSLFSDIKVVRLETSENCLITRVTKLILKNNLIYVLNEKKNVFVCSAEGKFIQEISRKGRALVNTAICGTLK